MVTKNIEIWWPKDFLKSSELFNAVFTYLIWLFINSDFIESMIMKDNNEDGTTEKDQLHENGKGSRLHESVAILAICFVHFGDAVEVYLPSVLTQAISCDLLLSNQQQGFLSVTFYTFYGLGSFFSGYVTNFIGIRKTIIISLLSSYAVTASAALSTNFTVLLITRALTGILVGSNYGITNIYWTDVCPDKARQKRGLFAASLCFSCGAGYTSILGYFLLKRVGWRTFFVICSLPIFLFPTVTFILYLKEQSPLIREPNDVDEYKSIDNDEKSGSIISGKQKALIFLLSVTYLVNIFQGWGLILFIPKLYHKVNVLAEKNTLNCSIIYGSQYIKMTLISGMGPLIAKTGAYLSSFISSYPPLLILSSSACTISTLLLLFLPEMDIFMGFLKAGFAFLNLTLWLFIMEEFKDRCSKVISASIIDGSSKIGALLGSVTVSFTPLLVSEITMVALGIAQTLSLICIKAISSK